MTRKSRFIGCELDFIIIFAFLGREKTLLSYLHQLSILEVKKVKVLVSQSCPIHGDVLDCSPPGPSVHGILQARILEWVPIFISRGSFQARDLRGKSNYLRNSESYMKV